MKIFLEKFHANCNLVWFWIISSYNGQLTVGNEITSRRKSEIGRGENVKPIYIWQHLEHVSPKDVFIVKIIQKIKETFFWCEEFFS